MTQIDGTPLKFKRQPVFNAPRSVIVLAILLPAIHLARLLMPQEMQMSLMLHFAFFPVLYSIDDKVAGFSLLELVRIWSPFTYAFLHINWMHVIVNTLWLTVFGSPVAFRFGARRFLVFCLLLAPAGALTHYLSYGSLGPAVIGASAIVSGLTAAALRFVFDAGGPFQKEEKDGQRFRNPAPSLVDNLRNRQVMVFLIIWLAINFIFGLGGASLDNGAQIAWQAHLGGFAAGLLFFAFFDPVKKHQ